MIHNFYLPGSNDYDSPLTADTHPADAERIGPISRFFIFCSGADHKLLARGGTETATYVGLGGTVVATSFLATVSSTFALSLAFSKPWWTILPISIMWGLIIFNLDRWLLSSYRSLSNQFKTLLSLIPRLLLAMLFGFIISEPMVLEIFSAEISEELRDVGETTRQDRLASISTGPESVQIAEKRAEIESLESQLGQSQDTVTRQLQADIAEQRALLEGWEGEITAATIALGESQASLEEEVIDGCADGGEGCVPGDGPIANQKRREVELRQQELTALAARVNPRIAEATERIAQQQVAVDDRRVEISDTLAEADSQVMQQIGAVNSEIDELELVMNQLRANINNGEIEFGILARIDALDTIRQDSDNINRLYWLLTALFISIDTIPVLGKWIMSFGPRRPYELLKNAKEIGIETEVERILERNEINAFVQTAAIGHLANALLTNDEHYIQHWASTKRHLGEAQLTDWEHSALPVGFKPLAESLAESLSESQTEIDITTGAQTEPSRQKTPSHPGV